MQKIRFNYIRNGLNKDAQKEENKETEVTTNQAEIVSMRLNEAYYYVKVAEI